MEQMLGSRAYALNGVLNGIDNQDWNPVTDKHLEHKYGMSNFSRGKVRSTQCLRSRILILARPASMLQTFSLADSTQHLDGYSHALTQALNKAALQKELALPERPDVSCFAAFSFEQMNACVAVA